MANKTTIVAEPGKHEVTITRTFDAPREMVYRVTNDPEALPRWWGPAVLDTRVETLDVKPGGSWRVIQKDPSGQEHGFHGVYHLADSPHRTVRTFEYEGMPGHVALETTTLEDLGGKTKMTSHSVFQSIEDRDGMIRSGMERGVVESHERLDALLAA